MNNQESYLLEHAVLNQIESDLQSEDFDSISILLSGLIMLEPAQKLLIAYLGDTAKENWMEGRTVTRY